MTVTLARPALIAPSECTSLPAESAVKAVRDGRRIQAVITSAGATATTITALTVAQSSPFLAVLAAAVGATATTVLHRSWTLTIRRIPAEARAWAVTRPYTEALDCRQEEAS